MLRWLTVLIVLALLTGLMSVGLIPVEAAGLARVLFPAYATLLAVTALIGLLRG